MEPFGFGAGLSWGCTKSNRRFIVPSKIQPVYYSYPKENQKVMGQLFFFGREKIFGRKNFSEKKVEKNVLSRGSLANFLNRLKDTGTGTVLEVPFLSRKSQKRWFLKVLCSSKIAAWATFACSFFVDKTCCKNREKTSPRLALLKCEWTLSDPLEYFAPFAV